MPKIIFCINQAAGREKRGRIDLKLQEGVFVLTSSGRRRSQSPEEWTLHSYRQFFSRIVFVWGVALPQWIIRSGPSSVSLSSEGDKAVMGSDYPLTRRHILEERNAQLHRLWNLKTYCEDTRQAMCRAADKSLARPGRKLATATEDFDVHISHL